jgi:hypothetical protein
MLALNSELAPQNANAVIHEFRASNYPQLRTIAVEDAEGGVLLRGRVRTYFMKQMAFITAAKAVGGLQILDEIVVGL